MQITSLIMLFSIFSSFTFSSCAQPVSREKILFAGSTPCDALIRQMAGIPQNRNCEFMKWEVQVSGNEPDGNRLTIQLTYGMTKANTNGFSDGWEKLNWTGRLEKMTANEKMKNVYVVKTDNDQSLFYLMKLGENIFHFTDSNGKPLTGNGGWGYVLNRISEKIVSK